MQHIIVSRRPGGSRSDGLFRIGLQTWPCLLGRSGMRALKREGDGATPVGTYRLLVLCWRPDRITRPRTLLPHHPIRQKDGWCDEPGHACYNRPVRLPFAASREEMWRDDRLYDLCLVTSHNQRPRARMGGSAIFVHLTAAKPHTEGCIGLPDAAMRQLLATAGPNTRLVILP